MIAWRPFCSQRKKLLLFLLIAAELAAVYLLAFENWQGPGDWGSNLGYLPAVMIAAGRRKELNWIIWLMFVLFLLLLATLTMLKF